MPEHTKNEFDQVIYRQRVKKVGGTTRYVNGTIGNDGSNGLKPHKPMKTIPAAILESESWDNIYVFDGIYTESIIVSVKNLIIHGESEAGTIIAPAATVNVITLTEPNIILENLKVVFPTGVGGTSAISFGSDHNTFRNVWLVNAGNDGWGFVTTAGDEQLIEDCRVDGFMNQMNMVSGNRHIIRRNILSLAGAGGINIYIDSTNGCRVYENDCDGAGAGTGINSTDNTNNVYFNNNMFDHGAGNNALENSANNLWRANYYDDCAPDIDNDGYGDSPYDVGNPAGTDWDHRPIPIYRGWLGIAGGAGGGIATYGSKEIFDSFEYPSDASLQARWIEGGDAGNPTRSATSYYGQYAMQTVIGAGSGYLYRSLTSRNMKSLANITIAAQSNNAGDTFRFTLYDSVGNYSYWTQTITLAATYLGNDFEIPIHSARTGGSATPVDLEDIVEIRLAELVAGSTYLFDLITFEGLVSGDIEEINYGDSVYVDDGGTDSTDYPYGTPTHPTLTLANGAIIAAARNLHSMHVQGLHAVDYSIAGYEILGTTGPSAFTTITGAAGINNANCTFEKCLLTGVLNGFSYFERDCVLYDVTGLDGFIRNCDLGGSITFADPSLAYIDLNKTTTQQGPITVVCTNIGAGDNVRFHNFSGTMTLTNLTNATAVIRIYASDGSNITVAASCTAGRIEIFGNCNIINTSATATVLRRTINAEVMRTLVYDNFNDNLYGYDWNAFTVGGSTAITEAGGKLKFANNGLGTTGESYAVSAYQYPRNIVVEAEIQVVDGHAAVDGEHAEAYIELYDDATHFIKFGPYRDETEGINSRGYIQRSGAVVDADATDIDTDNHAYKIVVASDMMYFYIDNVEVYAYQWGIVGGYENFQVRLGAATEIDADVIDARFDEFQISAFDRRMEQIWHTLDVDFNTMWVTIDQIFDQVNAILVTTETGGVVSTNGAAEVDVYINDTPAGVYKPLILKIWFTNQSAGETVVIREKYRIADGDGLELVDEETFAGLQDPVLKVIDLDPTRFGVAVTIAKTVGVDKGYKWEVIYDI